MQYGGTAPDFTQEEAFASMNPPSGGQEADPPLSASSRDWEDTNHTEEIISGSNQVASKEKASSSSVDEHHHHPEQVIRQRF